MKIGLNSGHHATSRKATNCDIIQSIKSEKTRNRFFFQNHVLFYLICYFCYKFPVLFRK